MKMLCIILLLFHGFLFHHINEMVLDIFLRSHLTVLLLLNGTFAMVFGSFLLYFLYIYFIFNSCISLASASLNTSTRLLLLEYRLVAS